MHFLEATLQTFLRVDCSTALITVDGQRSRGAATTRAQRSLTYMVSSDFNNCARIKQLERVLQALGVPVNRSEHTTPMGQSHLPLAWWPADGCSAGLDTE